MPDRPKARRPRHQVILQVMPGAEPWIRIEHSRGWFKLPLFCSIEELVQGVAEGWNGTHNARSGETVVRVPLAAWQILQLQGQIFEQRLDAALAEVRILRSSGQTPRA
jgi:hypothetical protein